jgi:hypothetical protein
MKLLSIVLLLGSLKYTPPKPEEPIKSHEDLVARIEKKYLRGPDPIGFDEPTSKADVNWVTPDIKPEVIKYLRNKAEDPDFTLRAQRPLFALYDEETVLHVIKQFENGDLDSLQILQANLNRQNLKYLIPLIYQGSSTPRDVGFGLMQSPKRQAIGLFLDNIGLWNGFNGPSINWAMGMKFSMQKIGDDPHIMWLFQQWWEHNREAVLSDRFSEATWVPLYKGKPDVFDIRVRNEPEYRNYSSGLRNDILEIPKEASIVLQKRELPKTSQLPAATAPATPPKANHRNALLWSLGAVGLLLISWLWSKRTKRASAAP